jgi:uncharacterized protein (TIGR00369 family)
VSERRFRHLRQCYGCGVDNDDGLGLRVTLTPTGASCRARFGAGHQGAPGLVHGGLLVTLLDEVMGSLPFEEDSARVTRSMDVRFLKPVAIERDVEAVATVGERSGRRVAVTGTVCYLDDPVVRVRIEAEYVILAAGGLLSTR